MKLGFRALSQLRYIGVSGDLSPMDRVRVTFLNYVLLVTGGIVILLVIVNALLKNGHVQPINAFSLIIISSSLYFNKRGLFRFTRVFFILCITMAIVVASLRAYHLEKFTETENLLYIVVFMSVFLLSGYFKYGYFLLVMAGMFWLKAYKLQLMGWSDESLYLRWVNTGVIGVAIFFFAESFRSTLQRALVENERQKSILFSLIDHLPLFIATVGSDRRYIMVNKKYENFGKPREDIIGEHVKDVLPPPLYDRHAPLIERAFQGEEPTFVEQAEMPDGRLVHSAGKYVPIKNSEGKIDSITVFASDISELKKAEEALIEVSKTKDRLLSIVAHDVKNPLNIFQSLLMLEDEALLSPDELKAHKETLRLKVGELNSTLDQILHWGRTQMEGMVANPMQVNISEILLEKLHRFEDFSTRKKVKISKEVADNLLGYVDENHFRLVVRNILHNALKFTPEGKSVLIKATHVNQHIQVEIRDEGVGMDEATMSKIRKGEVHNSTYGTQGESGTGLGMSMTVELLKKNKCALDLSSAVGAGTTFTITIPMSVS